MKHRLLFLATAERLACALTLAFAAGAAHAVWTWPDITTGSMIRANLNWLRQHQKCGPAGVNPAGFCIGNPSGSRQTQRANAALLYTGADFATTAGIDQLVASFPAENQPQIAQVFKTLIVTFNKTAPRTFGIPANNLATAFAAILAGSYAAYTNQPFPENAVKPLYRQIRQAMLNNPNLSQGSMEEKNAMYQMWVGVGAYMLGWQAELAKHPDPQQQAQMQKAGADILRSLSIDPDRVSFTTSGMQMD